jgi:RHS repeat-associated protein
VVVEATDKAGNETVETFTLFFDPRARATYRYDLNGNLIQKTVRGVVWCYEWDVENRLVRVRKATTEGAEDTEVEYGYYDNGNRAWKRVTEPGQEPVVTHYVHDGIHVIAEYDGEGDLLNEYVYSDSIDEVLNIKDGAENIFPHQDGLNSVVAVTDASGERIASYNYEAFGTIKDATGALGNPITYTGRWIEPETGDYFYRARYYDAGIGRFLKRDPIGFESGDLNLYRYVRNRPTKYVDPFGLEGMAPDAGTGVGGFAPTFPFKIPYSGLKEIAKTGKCKPCIPEKGTKAGRKDCGHKGKKGIKAKPHIHLFEMNQSPYPACRCFWHKTGVIPGTELPPGYIPIVPPSGGGPDES